jgi:hypothetical protein
VHERNACAHVTLLAPAFIQSYANTNFAANDCTDKHQPFGRVQTPLCHHIKPGYLSPRSRPLGEEIGQIGVCVCVCTRACLCVPMYVCITLCKKILSHVRWGPKVIFCSARVCMHGTCFLYLCLYVACVFGVRACVCLSVFIFHV